MPTKRFGRAAALAASVLFVLSACGGGASSDPQGSVKAAFEAVNSGGLAKMTDFMCAAKRGDPAAVLGSGISELTQAGVSATDLMNAITVKVSNVTTTEKSKTDKAATVHVTADTQLTFDKDKFRNIMKTVLTAQGKPTDDATLDLVMNALSSQMSQTQKMDEDIELVNEGGKWLVCE
jgi:hypothetical protein